MKKTLRIGTRGSRLARWQAAWVEARLREHFPDLKIEQIIITTRGDKILDTPLAQIGGKGLFIKELEQELLAGTIDIAVHSLKDMPAELPAGLAIAALTEREEARDALVSLKYKTLADLPSGATIGTSSLRRQAQLLALRPDLKVLSLRGNVDTRLRKLADGQYEAIILAAAGLKRLGLEKYITELLPADKLLAAGGQGIMAVEIRENDRETRETVMMLHSAGAAAAATAERAFLRRVGGSCQIPVAAQAVALGDEVVLTALIASPDGTRVCRGERCGKDAEQLGTELAEELLGCGGREILAELAPGS